VYGSALVVTDDTHGQLPFVRAHFTIDDATIRARASRLGYTRAIVRVRALAPDEARATRVWNARTDGVPTGAWRDAGAHVFLFSVVVIGDDAPALDGAMPVHRRRLSGALARFMSNVCGLTDGARVLDPFVGRGTLAHALAARGLDVTCGDVDARVIEALSAAARFPRTLTCDARALPFDDDTFDGVITEPPYRAHERAAVVASMRELARVVRPDGVLALLVADGMYAEVMAALTMHGCVEHASFAQKRHGLACTLVVARCAR
jgi:SAM-dependent methyltransferase